MAQDQIVNILQAYGADPEVLEEYDCLPLRVRIVRNVLKVRTPTGARALKKVYMSDQRLAYVHQLTEHVAAGGFDGVPRFIRTRYGDPYVAHPSGLYYMTPWLPGRDADLRKESELLAVTRLLARWQQTAAAFAPEEDWHPDQPPFYKRLAQGLADLKRVHEQSKTNALPSPFEKLVNACADEVAARIEAAQAEVQAVDLDQVEQEAKRRGYMCHGAFHKQNILFDGDAYTILNYEFAHSGPPIYDFAMLLHRYMPAYEWDSAVVSRLFDAYERLWGRREEDAPVLCALLAAPLRSMQVLSWYAKRDKEWEEDDYVDYLEASLELEEAREEARHALMQSTPIPVSFWQRGDGAGHSSQTVVPGNIGDVQQAVETRSAVQGGEAIEIEMVSDVSQVAVEPGNRDLRTKSANRSARRIAKLTPRKREVFQPRQPGLWVNRDEEPGDRS